MDFEQWHHDSNQDFKHLGCRESTQKGDPYSQFSPNHDRMRILSIWVKSIFSKVKDWMENPDFDF